MKNKVMAVIMLLTIAVIYYLMGPIQSVGKDFIITTTEESHEDTSTEPDPKNGGTKEASQKSDNNEEYIDESLMIIDIDGAVRKPGIVRLVEKSRVFEAVDQAGGLSPNADTSSVNMASELKDGEKIYIPNKNETAGSSGYFKNKLININTADSETLENLNGIGPATAEMIIQYRSANGKFSQIEDIKNVSGIGDKTFEKFKSQICVN